MAASCFVVDRDEPDSDDSHAELSSYLSPPKGMLAPIASCETLCDQDIPEIEVPSIMTDDYCLEGMVLSDEPAESSTDSLDNGDPDAKLLPPNVKGAKSSFSSDSLSGHQSPHGLSSTASSDTLTPGSPKPSPISSPTGSPRKGSLQLSPTNGGHTSPRRPSTPVKPTYAETYTLDALALSPTNSPVRVLKNRTASSPVRIPSPMTTGRRPSSPKPQTSRSPSTSPKLRRAPSPIRCSYSSPSIVTPQIKIRPCKY